MKHYDCYFFDLFHTLIRFEPNQDRERNEFSILGISHEEWNDYVMREYAPRALGEINDIRAVVCAITRLIDKNLSEETIDLLVETRKERYRKALVLVNRHVLNTIADLYRKGKTLVLVSNADVFDKFYWNDSPLSKYFAKAIFSCDVGVMKPQREIYELAMDAVNADPAASIFIGDGGHDELAGAKEAGLATVLTTEIIRDLWPERIAYLSKHADFVIGNLAELC